MAKTTLVTEEILVMSGAVLLDALKREGIKVTGALWIQSPLFQRWQLELILPLAERLGVFKTSERVAEVLDQMPWAPMKIKTSDVSVNSPDSSFAQAVRRTLRGTANTHLHNVELDADESPIEDGYVYFVK